MSEQRRAKTLHVNGVELHYVERGQGDPVVFVHGGLGDFRTWSPQMEPFAAHYHAIAYSRRSHYPNAWAGDEATSPMMLHVQDLAALIEALQLGSVHIVANSYGGYLSLFLALQHPQLVRTLSLAEPPVHPFLRRAPGGEEMFQHFMATAWKPAGQAFARGEGEQGVRLFIEGAIGKGAFDSLPPRVREGMMKNAAAMSADTQADYSLFMPDVTCEDVGRIEAPALLLRGELSPRMYYLINDALAHCLPRVEQALIPGASHVLHSHNPEAHNEAVLSFLVQSSRFKVENNLEP